MEEERGVKKGVKNKNDVLCREKVDVAAQGLQEIKTNLNLRDVIDSLTQR